MSACIIFSSLPSVSLFPSPSILFVSLLVTDLLAVPTLGLGRKKFAAVLQEAGDLPCNEHTLYSLPMTPISREKAELSETRIAADLAASFSTPAAVLFIKFIDYSDACVQQLRLLHAARVADLAAEIRTLSESVASAAGLPKATRLTCNKETLDGMFPLVDTSQSFDAAALQHGDILVWSAADGPVMNKAAEANQKPTRHQHDADAPKEALSPYMLWLKDTRIGPKKEFPDLTNAELLAKAAGKWQVLGGEEKKEWVDLAAQLKAEYATALAKYLAGGEEAEALRWKRPAVFLQDLHNRVDVEFRKFDDGADTGFSLALDWRMTCKQVAASLSRHLQESADRFQLVMPSSANVSDRPAAPEISALLSTSAKSLREHAALAQKRWFADVDRCPNVVFYRKVPMPIHHFERGAKPVTVLWLDTRTGVEMRHRACKMYLLGSETAREIIGAVIEIVGVSTRLGAESCRVVQVCAPA